MAHRSVFAVDPARGRGGRRQFQAGGALRTPCTRRVAQWHVSLDTFCGESGRCAARAVARSQTTGRHVPFLEKSLLAHTRPPHWPEIRPFALATGGVTGQPMRPRPKCAERIGLSPRRFIQLFTNKTGDAKLFWPCPSFQEVFRLVRTKAPVDWGSA